MKRKAGDPFAPENIPQERKILRTSGWWIFKKQYEYKLAGFGINVQEGPSVKELVVNSAFAYELVDSETLRGAFALNPPSMKIWIYFFVGLLIGALLLGKIFYGVVHF